jgi:hypothetical protein
VKFRVLGEVSKEVVKMTMRSNPYYYYYYYCPCAENMLFGTHIHTI